MLTSSLNERGEQQVLVERIEFVALDEFDGELWATVGDATINVRPQARGFACELVGCPADCPLCCPGVDGVQLPGWRFGESAHLGSGVPFGALTRSNLGQPSAVPWLVIREHPTKVPRGSDIAMAWSVPSNLAGRVGYLAPGAVAGHLYDWDVNNAAILIDESSAEPLPEAEIRAWARDQRAFISSVMQGMVAERSCVAAAIEDLGAQAVWFEQFGGRDDDPESAYLAEVASSDVYIGLLGERYGKPLPSGFSATHAEYRAALDHGLRTSVWVSDGELVGPQRDFVEEIRVFRTTGSYSSPEDLAANVSRRLKELAADASSPWVKVGPVIFRSSHVEDDGSTITVEARVRNAEVLAALESMRPDGIWGRSHESVVTWAGRTAPVRVEEVRTETRAGRGARVTLVAQRNSGPPTGSMVDGSMEGRSPEDLTELALRVALFDEPNPLGLMGFMAEIGNPFEILDEVRLSADAVEPVVALLFTEELVGGQRAERITRLQVGPLHRGRRRVELEWAPRQRSSNVIPDRRRIEGEVLIRPA